MTPDSQIELGLHSALDVVSLPTTIPADVLRRARNDRAKRLVTAAVVVVAVTGFWATAGRSFIGAVDIQPANRRTVPFMSLPVNAGSQTLALVGSPLAPPGFPDCTTDNVDVRTRAESDFVDVTLRPREGVQCGLDWWSEGFWTDASGEVYKPPRTKPFQYSPSGDTNVFPPRSTPPGEVPTRLLLMGDAGATHGAIVAGQVCRLEAPITYSIKLAGEAIEIGTIEDPHCMGTDKLSARDAWSRPYSYRFGGIETPAGWLRPSLEVPVETSDDTLEFILSLVNDTDEAISLDRCPFFDATFSINDREVHLRSFLNCPAAPDTVEPGSEVRFPIELPIAGIIGTGRIDLVLRDERRQLQRLTSEEIEVTR